MILYFSATGNTEYIAKKLAKELNEECINLLNRIRNNDYSVIESDKPFIICSPVYICSIPLFYRKFLKNLELKGNKNVYFIFTSGGYSGISGYHAKKLVKKKKMKYMGRIDFKMPRNYLIGNRYPMLSHDENLARLKESKDKLNDIIEVLKNNQKAKARHIWLLEKIITIPFIPFWYKYKIKADGFYTKDNCVGCGKCEKLCPVNNIKLKDKKPIWGNECYHCMACIANCPMDAIEFDDRTKGKERYILNKYLKEIEDYE